MTGAERLLKVTERREPSARLTAEKVIGILENRSDAREIADAWLNSGYKIAFEEMRGKPSRFLHEQKRFVINTNASLDEMADALARGGREIGDGYARLRLCDRSWCDNEEERGRLASLIDACCSEPGGRDVLRALADKKTFICLTSKTTEGKSGEFEPKYDMIFLKKEVSDKEAAAALLACSREAVAYAERPAKDVLKSAFQSKTSEEQNDFDRMVDTAYRAPIGKEILDKLAAMKYDIVFDDLSASKAAGTCCSSQRRIVIDPKMSFESRVVTLIHEAEHALQGGISAKGLDQRSLRVADIFKKERAMEADACAHEALFVWQIKDVAPEIYAEAVNDGKETTGAFVYEMQNGADEVKAMEAAFKAWYDSPFLQSYYEDSHAKYVEGTAKWGADKNIRSCFSLTCTEREILEKCLFNGAPYVSPEFLASENACAVSEKTRTLLQEVLADYSAKTGMPLDASLSSMPSREFLWEKEKFSHTLGRPADQLAEFEAFVDAVAKLPEAKSVMDDIKGVSLWFENAPEGAPKIRYMPEADALIVDSKDPAASVGALAEECSAIRSRRLLASESDVYRFEPSLDISPEKEAEHLKRVIAETERDPAAAGMHERMRGLHYKVAFERIANGDKARSFAVGTTRRLVIDPTLPLKEQAEGMFSEMKKVMERHNAELPMVDSLIRVRKDAAAAKMPDAAKSSPPAREADGKTDVRMRLNMMKTLMKSR